jgi:hypothetical protein
MYCYFATVDKNWNSAYPYVVGPTFYGVKSALKVQTITESVTTYNPPTTSVLPQNLEKLNISVFPNPAGDLVALQINNVANENFEAKMYDLAGKLVQKTILYQGSTIAYFDTQTLYSGQYLIVITIGSYTTTRKVVIEK